MRYDLQQFDPAGCLFERASNFYSFLSILNGEDLTWFQYARGSAASTTTANSVDAAVS